MKQIILLFFVAISLFAVILGVMEVGRRVGRRRNSRDPDGALAGLARSMAQSFGLMGLLVAFTFSGAAGISATT